jgi:hypothetical protein
MVFTDDEDETKKYAVKEIREMMAIVKPIKRLRPIPISMTDLAK